MKSANRLYLFVLEVKSILENYFCLFLKIPEQFEKCKQNFGITIKFNQTVYVLIELNKFKKLLQTFNHIKRY